MHWHREYGFFAFNDGSCMDFWNTVVLKIVSGQLLLPAVKSVVLTGFHCSPWNKSNAESVDDILDGSSYKL